MPKGITEELLHDVWAENTWQFLSLYKYPSVEESARVSGGFLLKDIWKVCVTGVVHWTCPCVMYTAVYMYIVALPVDGSMVFQLECYFSCIVIILTIIEH